MNLDACVRDYTEQINRQGLLRSRVINHCAQNSYLHFDSNDYLSLRHDPMIAAAYQKAYANHPAGSGGSMLLSGYHSAHQDTEKAFAEFLAVDECILFSSGYAANLALTALLGQLNAFCFIDKSVHASIYDGLKLAQVPFKRFRNNQLERLQRMLDAAPAKAALITEGIFGMSGQLADLNSLAPLCQTHEMPLIVDEAHSFGVVGPQGRGLVAACGLDQNTVPLRCFPLGKAFAAQGAIIGGKKTWIDALMQAGRSLIYSTSISPALGRGLKTSLEVVMNSDDRRARLTNLVKHFRHCISESAYQWSDSTTPIQQLQLGCPHRALYYAHELKTRGIICSAIRAPTVSPKLTGLRIILNFDHTAEQINHLFSQLKDINEHPFD